MAPSKTAQIAAIVSKAGPTAEQNHPKMDQMALAGLNVSNARAS